MKWILDLIGLVFKKPVVKTFPSPKKKTSSKVSQKGLDLLKRHEGLRLEAYMPTPNDVPTIGYGHTKGVKMGMKITREQAEQFLIEDLAWVERAIAKYVQVPLNQNQYDALVSFIYNVGAGAFLRSTLLKKLNEGDYKEVPRQLMRWNKQKGKVLAGLTKRRKEESLLWKGRL